MTLFHRLIGGLALAVASALFLLLWRPASSGTASGGGLLWYAVVAGWLVLTVGGLAAIIWPMRAALQRATASLRCGAERASAVADRMSGLVADAAARSVADDEADSDRQIAEAVEASLAAVEQAHAQVVGTCERLAEAAEVLSAAEAAAGETGRLVRVLDELAFQANLLSLNAGVEVAQAGPATDALDRFAAEARTLADRGAGAAREASRICGNCSTRGRLASEAVAALVASSQNAPDAWDAALTRLQSLSAAVRERAVWREASDAPEQQAVTTVAASAADQLATQAGAMRQLVRELEPLVGRSSTEPATHARRPMQLAR